MADFKVALFAANQEPFRFIHLMLSSMQCEVEFFEKPQSFLGHLKLGLFEIAILDLDLSPSGSLEILKEWSRHSLHIPVMGVCRAESTSLLKFGIPLLERRSVSERFVRLFEKVRKQALGYRKLQKNLDRMIGDSPAMQTLKERIAKIAEDKGSVMIYGESGTGKELVAKAIASFRNPFVPVNCSAIPEALFESEFFGHQRGAFTGAVAERKGLFLEAQGGTLFLDEIAELPLSMQAKLLRVLQEGEIKPVGSDKYVQLDVRIVAATHKKLEQEVAEGRFREDLYYRLNIIPVQVLPLRERNEDLLELCQFFLKKYSPNIHLDLHISPLSLEEMMNYPFPGNIRELENKIQTGISIQQPQRTLDPEIFIEIEKREWDWEWKDWNLEDFKKWKTYKEKEFIELKLRQHRGNVIEAAQDLGMVRTALHNKIRALEIDLKHIQRFYKQG